MPPGRIGLLRIVTSFGGCGFAPALVDEVDEEAAFAGVEDAEPKEDPGSSAPCGSGSDPGGERGAAGGVENEDEGEVGSEREEKRTHGDAGHFAKRKTSETGEVPLSREERSDKEAEDVGGDETADAE